jgi:hypothetical protein
MACCAKALLRLFKLPIVTDKTVVLQAEAEQSQGGNYDFRHIVGAKHADLIEMGRSVEGTIKKKRWIDAIHEKKRQEAQANALKRNAEARSYISRSGSTDSDETDALKRSISPKSMRRRENDEKNKSFSLLSARKKVLKLTNVLDRALVNAQKYNRNNQEDKVTRSLPHLEAVRESVNTTLPWVTISIHDEELRLRMLGYGSHVMFETFWRDSTDVRYASCKKWHRQSMNHFATVVAYLSGEGGKAKEKSIDESIGEEESTTVREWEAIERSVTYVPLSSLCVDQMRRLHLNINISSLQKSSDALCDMTDDALRLYELLGQLNPMKTRKLALAQFKEGCHPRVFSAVFSQGDDSATV